MVGNAALLLCEVQQCHSEWWYLPLSIILVALIFVWLFSGYERPIPVKRFKVGDEVWVRPGYSEYQIRWLRNFRSRWRPGVVLTVRKDEYVVDSDGYERTVYPLDIRKREHKRW